MALHALVKHNSMEFTVPGIHQYVQWNQNVSQINIDSNMPLHLMRRSLLDWIPSVLQDHIQHFLLCYSF